MGLTKTQFKKFLISHSADELSRNHIFGAEPWLFAETTKYTPTCTYDEFRQAVADGITATKDDVFLAGSAVFGRSTTPRLAKLGREFGPSSDLDVVIISNPMFTQVWKQLVKAYYGGFPEILRFHGKFVFRGFVNEPDRDFKSTLLVDLIKRTQTMKKDVLLKTGITAPLKYRIYRNKTDAVAYHNYGFMKCQRSIRREH